MLPFDGLAKLYRLVVLENHARRKRMAWSS
jgi:hypothetical protein